MKLYRETINAIRQVLDKIEANGYAPTPQQIGEVKGLATWARICLNADLTPGEVEVEGDPPTRSTCPHGNPLGECNACDEASDFAYDAAREARAFGR